MKLEKQSLLTRTLMRDKGFAGLTILLSVVALIFIIGFLVMVFAIIGSELADEQYNDASASLLNVSTNRVVNATGANVNGYTSSAYQGCSLTVTAVRNATDGVLISSGNYTVSGCVINGSTASAPFINKLWMVNGTVSYEVNSTATEAISETTASIAGVTSWFPIIITITVMVALILLTVIIIVAIRSSGILANGS